MVELEELSVLEIPAQLPVLPLRNMVVFPGMATQILVGREASVQLVEAAMASHRIIAVAAQRQEQQAGSAPEDIHLVGVVAYIDQIYRLPGDQFQLLVRAGGRVRLREFVQQQPYLLARVELLVEQKLDSLEEQALAQNLSRQLQRMSTFLPDPANRLWQTVAELEKRPAILADFTAAHLDVAVAEKQQLLEEVSVLRRLEQLIRLVARELAIAEMGQQLQTQVREEVGQTQRELYLREQMRLIQKELGEGDDQGLEELRSRVQRPGLSAEARQEAERQFERLAHLSPGAAEYTVVRTYLDFLLALPWGTSSRDRLDLRRARRVLDQDHEGLDEVKERILEYLAVRRLKKNTKGPIFCFVGPPGVGKTSLGRSIARALGRKFVRLSLGGVHDEAEIRGHRRTYVGALPGRILQGLRQAGTDNPVVVLDEIDKLGSDFRGDPGAALLEVLDPEQNQAFVDHYLEVSFDLSRVMFIATANQLGTIPPALHDRLEIIPLSGYTEEEKIDIAQNHLMPRQLQENGLERRRVRLGREVMRLLIRGYTQEAGVRNLEREIGRLCRKLARQVVEGGQGAFCIDKEDLVRFLGSEKFRPTLREKTATAGIATGLAWTPVGGEIMFVEATKMKGDRGLTLTGQLGEVMRESAQIALSYVRTRAGEWDIPADFFERQDLHIHLPSGAIPKDGPSAGVTLATALLSLLTGRPVREDVAMTGEVTLRGRVLPVGGIKEKVLAAHRAGLSTVILPKRNEKDLEEVPEEVRRQMEFVAVEDLSQVFAVSLADEIMRRAA